MSEESAEEKSLYETKALTLSQWQQMKNQYIVEGWEYKQPKNESVVYVRKHISGPKNTIAKGWHPYNA